MNQTEYPSLATNDAVAGFVFQNQEPSQAIQVDRKALERACVDLICKLDNMLVKAKEMSKVDFVDESATVARNMLELLQEFSDEFLVGRVADQAQQEISRAMTVSHTYDEVLKTRPLKNALLRTFWKAEEIQEIQAARSQLGQSLIRSCAATLYHGIMLVGFDTEAGKQIDQSTVVFVNELKKSW